ncbi:MAG: FtsQ-type POTRA domain-containing protein [Candidatus Kapabacteria bacterium]|nr:FtsQ-type POTRA domain-containing protein [Candidatus Kapabacteria bacterium]MBX7154494.1 FtsQ-type POTRA domain-containing protein [Bacteroidota bacterium]
MNHTSTSELHKERGIGQFLVYVLVALFFVGAAIKWNSRQKITNLSLKGNTYITTEEIQSLCTQDSTESNSTIDLAQTRSLVLQHPFVRNASVEHINSNNVSITITERVPIAVLLLNDGSLKYVDEENVILPYRVINGMADLPLIRGLQKNSSLEIDTNYLQKCVALLNQVTHETQKYIANDISEMIVNRQLGLLKLKTSESNATILMGSMETVEENLSKLNAMYEYCSKQNNMRLQGLVDLRWKNKVIIRNS